MSTTAITPAPAAAQGAFLVRPESALAQLKELQAVVKEVMQPGEHFGVIPGTAKPTLLKPGAELLNNMYGFFLQEIEIVERTEQWDVPVTGTTFPLFRYLIKARLIDRNGLIVAAGVGEANSYETKYRYRERRRLCPKCGAEAIIEGKKEYGGGLICFKKKGGCGAKFGEKEPAIIDQPVGRVPNEDIHNQVNTLLKMAKKRAYVDATLSATRTSGMFTQDMEDFATLADVKEATVVHEGEEKEREPEKPPAEQKELQLHQTVVPVGPHKGKTLEDLDRKTLENQLAWLDAHQDKHPEYREQLRRYLSTDAFGGIFDQRPPEERQAVAETAAAVTPAAATPGDEIDARSRANRLSLLTAIEKALKESKDDFWAPTAIHQKAAQLETMRKTMLEAGTLTQEHGNQVLEAIGAFEDGQDYLLPTAQGPAQPADPPAKKAAATKKAPAKKGTKP